MSKKRERSQPRERLSPVRTVANVTDEFVDSLNIPDLPPNIPDRLADGIKQRIEAFLYHLKESRKARYAPILELRLVRDAHRAVLTAYELALPEAEVFYARFRRLVEDLGYVRTEVGYTRE